MREMTVEGKGARDPLPPHEHERNAVSKANILVSVFAKNSDGGHFVFFRTKKNFKGRRAVDILGAIGGEIVSGSSGQQRQGLV